MHPSPPDRHRVRAAVLVALLALVAFATALAQGAPAVAEGWLDHPLVDATTGDTFTVREHADGVVVVETMATWCGNCRRQLGNLAAAAAQLAGEAAPGVPVTYVVLSVEIGLPAADLAAYAASHGFAFRFAVADEPLLRTLAERFGRVVLNPPSTPHVVVAPGGRVGPLATGFSSPDTLVAMVAAAAAP